MKKRDGQEVLRNHLKKNSNYVEPPDTIDLTDEAFTTKLLPSAKVKEEGDIDDEDEFVSESETEGEDDNVLDHHHVVTVNERMCPPAGLMTPSSPKSAAAAAAEIRLRSKASQRSAAAASAERRRRANTSDHDRERGRDVRDERAAKKEEPGSGFYRNQIFG